MSRSLSWDLSCRRRVFGLVRAMEDMLSAETALFAIARTRILLGGLFGYLL